MECLFRFHEETSASVMSMTRLPKVDGFLAQPGAKAYRLPAGPQDQFLASHARRPPEKPASFAPTHGKALLLVGAHKMQELTQKAKKQSTFRGSEPPFLRGKPYTHGPKG
jgi:hypothetical protein